MVTTLDERRLRHPAERPVYIASVVVNLALLVGAVALVRYGSDWLERHPRLAKRADELRAAAVAMLAAPFALTFLRNRRRATVRANSVRLSPTQIPEMYGTLERMCTTLGVRDLPELYVSEDAIDAHSAAYSTWRQRDIIVLDVRFLESQLAEIRDVYEFFIARELGRIRLGHTQWWDELLLAYVVRLPFLRNPLGHVRTYSHDRYALYLSPGCVRGLAVQASGRHMLKLLDVESYVRDARTVTGLWPRVANATRASPHVAFRIQALLDAGLLQVGKAERVPEAGRVELPAPATTARQGSGPVG